MMKYLFIGLYGVLKTFVVLYIPGIIIGVLSHFLYRPVDFYKFDNHFGAVISGLVFWMVVVGLYAAGGGFYAKGKSDGH